jgi:hypothetical protein
VDAAVGLRWRRATIVAAGVACLELLLLLAVGVYVFGRGVSHHVRAEAVKAARPAPARVVPLRRPAPSVPAPAPPRSQTSVLVLNGNGIAGAATAGAARLSALGYVLGGVGDAPQPLARTTVMYSPGFRAAGARLARDLHVRVVGPLDGLHPEQLLGARLVVVLGRS